MWLVGGAGCDMDTDWLGAGPVNDVKKVFACFNGTKATGIRGSICEASSATNSRPVEVRVTE